MYIQVTKEAFSSQKRPSNTSKHELFQKYFLLLWVTFALLDPDPDSVSGSTDLIESGSIQDPDPQPWLLPVLRIRRIHMFLGLPDPDPIIRSTDSDPSIIKQK
jgi:hypothetical protein